MLTYFRFFFVLRKQVKWRSTISLKFYLSASRRNSWRLFHFDISSLLLLRPGWSSFFYLRKIGIKFNGRIIIAMDSFYRVLLNLFFSLSASLTINCSSMKWVENRNTKSGAQSTYDVTSAWKLIRTPNYPKVVSCNLQLKIIVIIVIGWPALGSYELTSGTVIGNFFCSFWRIHGNLLEAISSWGNWSPWQKRVPPRGY